MKSLILVVAWPLIAFGQNIQDLVAGDELTSHRTINSKVFSVEGHKGVIAVFTPGPIHRLEGEEWVDMTRDEQYEAERQSPLPEARGKALSSGYYPFSVNGATVKKTASGTYDWHLSDRNIGKWSDDGTTYRSIFSFIITKPAGYYWGHSTAWIVWRDTPSNTNAGGEWRLIDGVQGVARQMYDLIGGGQLLFTDPVIAKPDHYAIHAGNPGESNPMVNKAIAKGQVHLALKGNAEGSAGPACSLGKWGTADAPEWPYVWQYVYGIDEPNTYICLIFYFLHPDDYIPAKVVADEEKHIVPHTWGEVKEETPH